MEGRDYEEKAVRQVTLLASIELGIHGPNIVLSKFGPPHPNFTTAMHAAIDTGLISPDEYRDLIRANLIIYGQNHHHAVVETSLGPDDIDRVLRLSRAPECWATGAEESCTTCPMTQDDCKVGEGGLQR